GGGDPQRSIIVGNGFAIVAVARMQYATLSVKGGVAPVDTNGLIEITQSELVIPREHMKDSPTQIISRISRFQDYRSIKISACPLVVPLHTIEDSTLAVAVGEPWSYLNCPVAIDDRALMITLVRVCNATSAVSFGIIRIDPDRRIIVCN